MSRPVYIYKYKSRFLEIKSQWHHAFSWPFSAPMFLRTTKIRRVGGNVHWLDMVRFSFDQTIVPWPFLRVTHKCNVHFEHSAHGITLALGPQPLPLNLAREMVHQAVRAKVDPVALALVLRIWPVSSFFNIMPHCLHADSSDRCSHPSAWIGFMTAADLLNVATGCT